MEALTAIENAITNGWSVSDVSEANKEKTVTKAAVSRKTHYLTGFSAVVTAAAAANTATGFLVTILDGTTVKWAGTFPASAAVGTTISGTFPAPIPCTPGAAANMTCVALGTSSIARLNLNGFTI